MARDAADNLGDRQYESYEDTGAEKSAQITLSGTPGTIFNVTVPAWAKGFKFYPRAKDVRFAVSGTGHSRTLAAVAALNSTPSAVDGAFAVGGIAKADQWEKRLLPSWSGRVLQLMSADASVVIDLEIF